MFYLRTEEIKKFINIIEIDENNKKLIILYGNKGVGKSAFVKYISRYINSEIITFHDFDAGILFSGIVKNFNLNEHFDLNNKIESEDWEKLFVLLINRNESQEYTLFLDHFHYLHKNVPDIYFILGKILQEINLEKRLNLVIITDKSKLYDSFFDDFRANHNEIALYTINIRPFSFLEFVKVYHHFKSSLSIESIEKIYLILGGYPNYLKFIEQFNLWNYPLNKLLTRIAFSPFSPLTYEINKTLSENFPVENYTYYKILEAISLEENTLTKIATFTNVQPTTLSKYLIELERRGLIKRKQPISIQNSENSKFGKYEISAFYKNFWFRFIYPYQYQLKNYDFKEFKEHFVKDIKQYLKKRRIYILREFLRHSDKFPQISCAIPSIDNDRLKIGGIWDRKEMIEVAALDSQNKILLVGFYARGKYVSAQDLFMIFEKRKHFKEFLENHQTFYFIFQKTNKKPYAVFEHTLTENVIFIHTENDIYVDLEKAIEQIPFSYRFKRKKLSTSIESITTREV